MRFRYFAGSLEDQGLRRMKRSKVSITTSVIRQIDTENSTGVT